MPGLVKVVLLCHAWLHGSLYTSQEEHCNKILCCVQENTCTNCDNATVSIGNL